jgi:ribosome maturation protein Sdo1
MSRSHIRIKSLISVRMAAEMYKNTASYSEIASRENGSDGRPGRWSCVVHLSASDDERGHWQLARE